MTDTGLEKKLKSKKDYSEKKLYVIVKDSLSKMLKTENNISFGESNYRIEDLARYSTLKKFKLYDILEVSLNLGLIITKCTNFSGNEDCNKVRVNKEWIEPNYFQKEIIARKDYPVSHGICDLHIEMYKEYMKQDK